MPLGISKSRQTFPQKVTDWTWSLKKEFSATEILENTHRKQLLFCKLNLPRFSQLIFYWNAFRPEKGYFSFSAQVLDEKNKWHDWHPMADWGKDVQRSFFHAGVPEQNIVMYALKCL